MAKKFGWVFRSPKWSLRFEALLFGLLLWWVWATWLNAFALLVWLCVASYFYFRSPVQRGKLLISYLGLLAVTIASASIIVEKILFSSVALIAAILFYLLQGTKEYYFIDRARWYGVVQSLLGAWAALLLFSGIWSPLFVIGIYFFFILEFLRYIVPADRAGVSYPPLILALSFSLLLYQYIWAIGLLPIGFLSQAALLLVLLYALRTCGELHLKNAFTTTEKLRLATFVIVFSATLLLTSQWVP